MKTWKYAFHLCVLFSSITMLIDVRLARGNFTKRFLGSHCVGVLEAVTRSIRVHPERWLCCSLYIFGQTESSQITLIFGSIHSCHGETLVCVATLFCWNHHTRFVGPISHTNTQGLSGNLCQVDCSNRGTCDYETGLCECFTGYYGYNCGLQSVLAK